jgi:opacity protein-like surface antigen
MKRQKNLTIAAFLTVLMFGADFAKALEPIPQESGFSGYIRPGVGYIGVKSNMVARFLGVDVSEKKAGSLFDSPESKSSPFFLIPFSLEYSFADTRTQLFIGTEPTDLIRFDYSQQVGIKQEIGKFGIIQGGFLFNTIALKVWQDPYVAGYQDRVETDRKSNGGRLVWDRPFGTQLQVQYSYRKIDLGKDTSGEFLGLNREQRDLLDRNGNRHIGEILYRFDLTPKHRLTPTFRYTRNDLDGGAMAGDAVAFQFTYTFLGDPYTVIANVFFGYEDYDERNPIYNKYQTDDHIGLQASLYYKNPWGWRIFGSNPINFYVSGAFVNSNSNIDFYDQQAILATGGVLFRW